MISLLLMLAASSDAIDPRLPPLMPQPLHVEGDRRYDSAVLFFAPPNAPFDADEPVALLPLWFAPVVCVHKKMIRYGSDCADLLPRSPIVRTSGGSEITLERGGGIASRAEGLRRPYAPACCNYVGCHGKTVPLRPRGAPLVSTRAVVAVWPADADVGLVLPVLGIAEALDQAEHAALTPLVPPGASLLQVFEVRSRRYASVFHRIHSGLLLRRAASRWTTFAEPLFRMSDAAVVLSATDINHDGKNELLVYAAFANDYALAVIADDDDKSGYAYSCGNI